jgi:hypothetical protein
MKNLEGKEIELPICVRLNLYKLYKVLSESEVIEVHVWESPTFKGAQLSHRKNARYILEQSHTVIPESVFQSHLTRAKQIIDAAYNKAVTKAVGFGERNDYKAGEVVVWNGIQPCICRIEGRAEHDSFDYYSSTVSTHTSLHYTLLRPATPEEIELLGDNEIYYL